MNEECAHIIAAALEKVAEALQAVSGSIDHCGLQNISTSLDDVASGFSNIDFSDLGHAIEDGCHDIAKNLDVLDTTFDGIGKKLCGTSTR